MLAAQILAAETAHSGRVGFPLLTTLILLPAVAAVVVALIPRTRPETAKLVGLLATVSTGVLSIVMLTQFQRGEAGFQFVSSHVWIKDFGISWHLGVDGISLFLVVLSGVLFPVAMAAPAVHKNIRSYTAWMLLLEAGCIGSFVALDLLVFFLMFELTLVPMYFLIGGWGYANRVYAALKFFVYTMAGSAFLIVGIFAVVFLEANHGHPLTFDIELLAKNMTLPLSTARWIFLAFTVAFTVKTPLFPMHTWLPDAHTEAPTGGSVILAGILLKLGTYGFLRFGLFLFPEAARSLAPLFLTLAVIGMTYGAIVAAVQKDLKRLVAYSSVAHLGFIILGLFAFTTQGLSGGVIQMVNHGLTTGCLFLLVGWIYERRHTRQIAELNGLLKAAPWLGIIFLVVMLASIGVPGLNGFVGEFLVLIGTYITHKWWAVVGATGVILAAVYLLWAFQRVFHGEPTGENETMKDLNWRERAWILPLVGVIVFLGVYPKPVLDRIEPSVDRVLVHVHDKTGYQQPAVAEGSRP